MADKFAGYTPTLESPSGNAAAVTPGATELANTARALYVGTEGNVVVTMLSGDDVTFASVPAGMILPIRVTHVLAGTTASNIVAIW